MNPKTVIKGKIHYVGVNDRNKIGRATRLNSSHV